MTETGIGRLLIASLHQSIADLLPTRLAFYEEWLSTAGLRDGRIGLAQMAAVLSFLRQEGPVYQLTAARAGEYTGDWTVNALSPVERSLIRRAPRVLRIWLVLRVARRMVRRTYTSSRAVTRWRGGEGAVSIRGSIFCELRDPVPQPLCAYYAAAIQRLMTRFDIDTDIGISRCRAQGTGPCTMAITLRTAKTEIAA